MANVDRRVALALMFAGCTAMEPPPLGQHAVTFRNDTGRFLACGLHKNGSSIIEELTLRPREMKPVIYVGSKSRWIRCEGAYSQWQDLALDGHYALVAEGPERVVARLLRP